MTPANDDDGPSGVHCRLDELLEDRGMTLTRLSELVGVSIVNLSVLKNDRARAILTQSREKLDAIARRLIEVETIDSVEFEKIFPRPYDREKKKSLPLPVPVGASA